jgi:stage III sporulation protein AA
LIERIRNEILRYFPLELKEAIIKGIGLELENIREIRVRVNKPIIFKLNSKDILLKDALINKELINKIFENICGNSIYAFADEISNGFITVFGGHRVGIVGKPVYKENKIYNIKDISGFNFRIAREIIGAGNRIISEIKVNGTFESTLIISPPGLGKNPLPKRDNIGPTIITLPLNFVDFSRNFSVLKYEKSISFA